MTPIAHTPQDIENARADCARRFGHARMVEVVYHDPISSAPLAEMLFAAFTYADAVAYYDARGRGSRWAMIADRMLFPFVENEKRERVPGLDMLAPLLDEWPAFTLTVEGSFRAAMGFSGDDEIPRCVVLTPDTAPPGLTADSSRALLASNAGARLWAVSLSANGLSLVWRQPTSDTWSLAARVAAEAQARRVGTLCPALATYGDHCLWTPDGPLQAHVDAAPGRAADLAIAWNAIGGVAARATARFL